MIYPNGNTEESKDNITIALMNKENKDVDIFDSYLYIERKNGSLCKNHFGPNVTHPAQLGLGCEVFYVKENKEEFYQMEH